MEKLITLIKRPEISIYKIEGDYAQNIDRFIVSTKLTRDVLNKPEITGRDFVEALQHTTTLTLKQFRDLDILKGIEDVSTNVLHFLRGGLNFSIMRSLNEAFGFKYHSASFMTSERAKTPEGRWYIKDAQYQKFILKRHMTLFCGDIVATGSTIHNGFNRLFAITKNTGIPLDNIVFFTIGCHKIEKILDNFAKLFKSLFKSFKKCYLFYFEGKFHLADSKTKVEIKLQGTDLMKYPAILAPEFELSQYENPSHFLERCVVYDGGLRSFDISEYLNEVISYWREVAHLTRYNYTLKKAIKERWPAQEYEQPFELFLKEKRNIYPDVSEELLEQLYEAHHNLWNKEFRKYSDTKEALCEFANSRIKNLTLEPVVFN